MKGKCIDLLDIYVAPMMDVRRPDLLLAVFQIVFKLHNTNFAKPLDLQTLSRKLFTVDFTCFTCPALVQHVTPVTIAQWERKVITCYDAMCLTWVQGTFSRFSRLIFLLTGKLFHV